MKEQILTKIPAACPWGDTLHWYDTIDSTNTRAKSLAAAGAPQGTTLIAAQQTGGRGRLGRSFHSPPGKGLYLSVVLRPGCAPEQLMHLTCAVGVCVCDAVEAVTGFRPGIKWINDLVAEKRKLGGILTELSIDQKTGLVDYAVIGIGLNCSHTAADFPKDLEKIATSLSIVTGTDWDMAELAAGLIGQLHGLSTRLLSHQSRIMAQYRRDCITVGQQIVSVRGDEKRYGRATRILEDGSLFVHFDDGTQAAVGSGEVSIRGMYGYV